MIKKLWTWFVAAIKETLNLSWTLVGLVIATLTLTGSAQQITGLATIITLAVWLLTISFRDQEIIWIVVDKVAVVAVEMCSSFINDKVTNVNICNRKYVLEHCNE